MNLLPNPQDLHFFLAVSQTLNFSRAAQEIGITQSAMSQGLKRLEQNLGVELLIRGKTGVRLTREGEKFLPQAQALVEQWSSLKDQMREGSRQIQGTYRFGMHESVALFTVGSFLKNILKEYPLVEFHFSHDLSRVITEEVIQYRLDFAIVVNPVAHPDLVIHELTVDEVRFWQHKNLKMTPTTPLISTPNYIQAQSLVSKLAKTKIRFSRQVQTQSLEVCRKMVEEEVGVGILPSLIVREAKNKNLQACFPEIHAFKDRICFIYRVNAQTSQAAKELARALRQNLQSLKK